MGARVCDIKKKFEGLSETSKDFSITKHRTVKLNSNNSNKLISKDDSENKSLTSISSKGNIKRSHAFRSEKGHRNVHIDAFDSIGLLNSNVLHPQITSSRPNIKLLDNPEANLNQFNKVLLSQEKHASPDKTDIVNTNEITDKPTDTIQIKSANLNNNTIHKITPNPKEDEDYLRPSLLQECPVISTQSEKTYPKNSGYKLDLTEHSSNNKTIKVQFNHNTDSDKTIDNTSGTPKKSMNDRSGEGDFSFSNTLKKVLKSPLPTGPPPKKPPRTFAHVIDLDDNSSCQTTIKKTGGLPNFKSQINNESIDCMKLVTKPVRSKTESQIMLKKLEMVLINHQNQGKMVKPNSNKTTITKEDMAMKDSKSEQNTERNINEINHLIVARKTSLPETPSSDKDNGTSGCFSVLSCSNSLGSIKTSHIYDLPMGPKSQFYVEKLKNSDNPSLNRYMSEDNNSRQLVQEASEPLYAQPLTKTKRKPPAHLGLANLSNVALMVRNLDSKSEILSETKTKVIGGFEKQNSSVHYMSSPILEHQPPTILPPSTKKRGPTSKKLFVNCDIQTFPGRASIVDLECKLPSHSMHGTRSLSLDFTHDKDVDNERIQKMVNEVYSKCLSMPQDSDSESVVSTPDESGPKTQPTKSTISSEEAQRERQQRTTERKIYLKRVCSRAKSFHRPSIGYPHLFEYLLLIGLDLNPARCKVPYIKAKYPEDANVPDGIEQLCFPDASEWPPRACADETGVGSCYCIVITHSSGSRKYGYCRRVQPEGAPICLPLAYCIVSPYKANRYFSQVLAELESRHGQPDHIISRFIQNLHQCPFPAPGKGLLVINPVTNEMKEILTRALDPRQEEMDLARLLNIVRFSVFLQIFVSLLLERKVVLLSYSISKLSTCVEGLCAAVYPFHWQHTLVPIVPSNMMDLCHAPTPYIIGLLKPRDPHTSPPSFSTIDQVLVVDVDECRVLQSCGDESTVLPSRLCRGLREAILCAVPDKNAPLSVAHNLVATEALMTLFVQLVGHYRSHVITSATTGKREFQREAFVRGVSSNTVQNFLDWFSETAMFTAFIESRLDRATHDSCGLFEQRCVEYLSQCQAPSKSYRVNLNKTVKIFGDRFKEWTSSS